MAHTGERLTILGFALALLTAFVGLAFAVGWIIGKLLL
jgi:hypothetical protein